MTSLTCVEKCVPDENNYRQYQWCLNSLTYLQQGHYIHLSSFLVVPTQTQQSEEKTTSQLIAAIFVTKAAVLMKV